MISVPLALGGCSSSCGPSSGSALFHRVAFLRRVVFDRSDRAVFYPRAGVLALRVSPSHHCTVACPSTRCPLRAGPLSRSNVGLSRRCSSSMLGPAPARDGRRLAAPICSGGDHPLASCRTQSRNARTWGLPLDPGAVTSKYRAGAVTRASNRETRVPCLSSRAIHQGVAKGDAHALHRGLNHRAVESEPPTPATDPLLPRRGARTSATSTSSSAGRTAAASRPGPPALGVAPGSSARPGCTPGSAFPRTASRRSASRRSR